MLSSLTFSVIICTFNRADYLADAIRSVQEQDYPPETYEIIVVDNGSTDETKLITEKVSKAEKPSLKYVFEPVLGLSVARNTGAKASNNEMLAYIDDDAIADPDWLKNLSKAYNSAVKGVVCVGGASYLSCEGQRPDWLTERYEGYLSSTIQLGSCLRILATGEYPVGTNFVINREFLSEIGGFCTELGRVGKTLLSGDESELCRRVQLKGGLILYAPDAVVHHRVPSERLTRGYILQRAYWQGVTDIVIMQKYDPRTRRALLRSTYGVILQQIGDGFRILQNVMRGRMDGAFIHLFNLVSRMGRNRAKLNLIIY
jgi:glycosyltransferase involved in cell wall biosynthesis